MTVIISLPIFSLHKIHYKIVIINDKCTTDSHAIH